MRQPRIFHSTVLLENGLVIPRGALAGQPKLGSYLAAADTAGTVVWADPPVVRNGRDGEDGEDGEDGHDGVSPVLQAGQAKALAAGDAPTVQLREIAPHTYAIDIGVPAGKTGQAGPAAARYARRHTTTTDGTVNVAFPDGLFVAPPVVSVTAEAAAGADVRAIPVKDSVTANGCTVRTVRGGVQLTAGLGGLLTAQLTVLAAPAVPVHVIAVPAT